MLVLWLVLLMTFTTRPYLKYLLPVPVVFGLLLLVWALYDYDTKTESQQSVVAWMIFIILIFFFGFPYLTFRYFKIIEVRDGTWIVKYPYLRRTVTLTREKVYRIEIVENISGRGVPIHDQINIRVRNASSIYINSMETKNFEMLRNLISADFRDVIHRSDFWTGRRKSPEQTTLRR